MAGSFEASISSSGDMSGNITSSTVNLDFHIMASIQAVWTGTPTGTIKLQQSNDASNWTDISGASQATGGAAGSVCFNLNLAPMKYVQLVYTRTSGSGTLNATVEAKG